MLKIFFLIWGGFMILTVVATKGGKVIENKDIPLPTGVLFTSSAFSFVLRWNFSKALFQNITYDADWQGSRNWLNECTDVKEQQCSILGILQKDQGILCTDQKTFGKHTARVRACVKENATQTGSRRCSTWAISNVLDLPSDDHLPQPNFEIYGDSDHTEIRVIGFPLPVKHSNKSLNCYHRNRLYSEIRYYPKDADHEEVVIVENDKLNISIPLAEKVEKNTKFCVRMRIKKQNQITNRTGDWKEKCTIYKPDVVPVPTEIFLSSSNFNLVLEWKFSNEEFADVYFEVEGHTYREWVPECQRTRHHSCNIVNAMLQHNTAINQVCPGKVFFGRYRARVRACDQTNQTLKCSDWAMSKDVTLPKDDKLPPPEFEIEGIYGSNRLQILTTPVLFKHTQTSLNCWYGNKLRYEIMFFYGYNGSLSEMVSSKSIRERRLNLPLQKEHLAGPRLCVKMRITKGRTEKNGSWKKHCIEIYPNIPIPTELEFSSVNLNPLLKWNLSTLTGNEIFAVEVRDDLFRIWEIECTRIEENYCSIAKGPLGEPTNDCPDYFFMQKYKARVRTCVKLGINTTEKCSAWAISEFLELPRQDEFPEPDFKIAISTQLLITNIPAIVKHSNKSLNCYYGNRLIYEIAYYGKNGSLAVEGKDASFDSQKITFPLDIEDLDGTEICVRMRIRDRVKNKNGIWNEKCVVYEAEYSFDMSLWTVISAVAFVLVLVIALCTFKGQRLYKSFHIEEMEMPKELVDMMEDLDGLNVCHTSMAEIIDSINYNDNTSIKCGIMIRKKSFSFHCTEVDLSCSSKIKVSSEDVSAEIPVGSARINSDDERSNEDSSWGSNATNDIFDDSDPISTPYDSRSESIPYIYSVQSTNDQQGHHGSAVSVSKMLDDATDDIRIENIENTEQSNQRNFRTYYPIKCLSETNLSEAKLREIIEPISYYVKRTTKKAVHYETDDIDVSTKNFNRVDSLVTIEPCSWLTDSRLVSKTSDCYTTLSEILLSQIKERSSNGNTDADALSSKERKHSNLLSTQSSFEAEDQHIETGDEGMFFVSIDNPTYNPNPTAFDFMDKIDCRPVSKIYDKVKKYPWLQYFDIGTSTQLVRGDYKNESNFTHVCESLQTEDFEENYSACGHLSRKLPLHDMCNYNLCPGRQDDFPLGTRRTDGFKTYPMKCKKYTSGGVVEDSYSKSRNHYLSGRRHHSCDSDSSTLSPFRDRIMSIDSGYHMGSSLADESPSLSPPISPVDIMFPDVFSTAEDFPNKLLVDQVDQNTYVDSTSNRDAFRHHSTLSHLLNPSVLNTARLPNPSVQMLPTLPENDLDERQMPSYVKQTQKHYDQQYMEQRNVASKQDGNPKTLDVEYLPYSPESLSVDYLYYTKVSKAS